MMVLGQRDFENYQVNKYLKMLWLLNLKNMCSNEGELSKVFDIK